MKRSCVISAVLVAAAVLAGSAAPQREARKPVVASTSVGLSAGLFLADPVTLKPLPGRRLGLPFDWASSLRSPDGSLLALESGFGRLDLVGLDPLRRVGRVGFGRIPDVRPLAWMSGRTLLAQAGASIAAIDARKANVLWRKTIGGTVLAVARAGSRVVLLVGPQAGSGPARLAVVGASGTVRTAVVERIFAGFEPASSGFALARSPGLAVDAAANRAWVVGADEPVAEIDLSAMTVGYTVSRTLAKVAPGPTRHALSLGGGRLAVFGTDGSMTRDASGNVVRETLSPSGLVLVDTGSAVARMVQPDAAAAVLAGGSLLAFGAGWDSARSAPTGAGVTVYGLDGTQRAHLFGATPITEVHSQGGLAYVTLPDRSGHVAVVDAATGTVLRTVSRPTLRVLAGD